MKNLHLLPLIALVACAEPAPDPVPAVQLDGPHSVEVGGSITLTATTTDGEDPSYGFESSDPTLALVDAVGVVTGLAAGEVEITATGGATGAQASHTVVVFDSVEPPPPPPPPADVPYYALWEGSAHADLSREAYVHFVEDEEVSTSCARCHASAGFLDYIGADGTAPFSVERAAPVNDRITCITCHDEAANALSEVEFPSGVRITGLGGEARCMTCHQGRSSSDSVDADIAEAAVGDDEVSADLRFINIHYYPAAATLFAGKVRGGYQYEGEVYDQRFRHVPAYDTCIECHEPHSAQVRFNECASCHAGVSDRASALNIRMLASFGQDYDGDGDREEGVAFEIAGLADQLLTAIQRYGRERAQPLCYTPASHPYFFHDTNDDGACGVDEAVGDNRYGAFTPRLLRATYNYQMVQKDPGGFAHNAKYLIQLLHDSLQDLNEGLAVPLDLSRIVRTDTGHFDGSSTAARRWDGNDVVNNSCSRCHSGAPGYRFFTEFGVGLEVPETANGLECATCHNTFEDTFEVLQLDSVLYPGDVRVELPGNDALCATCHAGRASKRTYDDAFAAGGSLRFQNVHYLAAGGTSFGADVKLGYELDAELPNKTYATTWTHQGGNRCTTCHDPVASNHTFRIADAFEARCDVCHGDANEAKEIRLIHLLDYDGDNNTGETLEAELDGMAERLLEAMHTAGGVCYAHAYPYFFTDTGGADSGHCDEDEAVRSNQFTAWTEDLLKAAHNYQLAETEPGAWAHNFDYIGQLLFDSVELLEGQAPTDLVRP